MSDFAKQAVDDIAKTVRQIKESSTSSMGHEDGGHFSFVIPEKTISPSSRTITPKTEKRKIG